MMGKTFGLSRFLGVAFSEGCSLIKKAPCTLISLF